MKVSLMTSLAALVLAACGGGSATQSPPTATSDAVGSSRSASWMSPLADADDLLYISNRAAHDVTVYSWEDQKLVGTLTGFSDPRGECVDKAGNVFITNAGTSQILKYAHGGTSPIATLEDPGSGPLDCSVDAVTGNLAVTNFSIGGGGNVIIYPNASGRPTRHFNLHFAEYDYCGYDDSGNLFIDGTNHSGHFIFPNFRAAVAALLTFRSPARCARPDPVGRQISRGRRRGPEHLEFSISGSTATHVGTTDLNGADPHITQFWIPKFAENHVNPRGRHVVAASHSNDRFEAGIVQIWAYPAGGTPRHTIRDGVSRPEGATVSPRTK